MLSRTEFGRANPSACRNPRWNVSAVLPQHSSSHRYSRCSPLLSKPPSSARKKRSPLSFRSLAFSFSCLHLSGNESEETVSTSSNTVAFFCAPLFRQYFRSEEEFVIITYNSSFPKTSSDAAGDGIIPIFRPSFCMPNTLMQCRMTSFPSSLSAKTTKPKIRKTGNGSSFFFSSCWKLLSFLYFFPAFGIRDVALPPGRRFFFFFCPKRRRKENHAGTLPAGQNFPSERRKATRTENCIKNSKNASETKFGAFFFCLFSFYPHLPSCLCGRKTKEGEVVPLFRLTAILSFLKKGGGKKNASCGKREQKRRRTKRMGRPG